MLMKNVDEERIWIAIFFYCLVWHQKTGLMFRWISVFYVIGIAKMDFHLFFRFRWGYSNCGLQASQLKVPVLNNLYAIDKKKKQCGAKKKHRLIFECLFLCTFTFEQVAEFTQKLSYSRCPFIFSALLTEKKSARWSFFTIKQDFSL